jgi:replicative DNA helicase
MNTQLQSFNAWKEDCLKPKQYFLDWGTPKINAALRGIKGGMSVLVAGQPNFGKSQLLTTVAVNILNSNQEDVIIIDFTLDDPKSKRITQYIASMAALDMNTIDFANNITDKNKLERFHTACEVFQNWIFQDKLLMYENSLDDFSGAQSKMSFITNTVETLRKNNPNKKIVVMIDSLNDVELNSRTDDPYLKSEQSSKELNRLITQTSSILIASNHLRKNGGKRPTLEDLKGNNFLAYSAKVVIGIHNDVKLNKGNAKVFWVGERPDKSKVNLPIVEAHFLKSKVSDFNGAVIFQQWPSQARLKEVENQERYLDMIYSEV